jgi:hypothetical protein
VSCRILRARGGRSGQKIQSLLFILGMGLHQAKEQLRYVSAPFGQNSASRMRRSLSRSMNGAKARITGSGEVVERPRYLRLSGIPATQPTPPPRLYELAGPRLDGINSTTWQVAWSDKEIVSTGHSVLNPMSLVNSISFQVGRSTFPSAESDNLFQTTLAFTDSRNSGAFQKSLLPPDGQGT